MECDTEGVYVWHMDRFFLLMTFMAIFGVLLFSPLFLYLEWLNLSEMELAFPFFLKKPHLYITCRQNIFSACCRFICLQCGDCALPIPRTFGNRRGCQQSKRGRSSRSWKVFCYNDQVKMKIISSLIYIH